MRKKKIATEEVVEVLGTNIANDESMINDIDIYESDIDEFDKLSEEELEEHEFDDHDDSDTIKLNFEEEDINDLKSFGVEFDSEEHGEITEPQEGESYGLVLTPDEKNRYVQENLGLVNCVAKKFNNTNIDEDELMGIAFEGFTKALNSYKVNKKTKFTTYAFRCMYNEILAHLRKEKKWMENVVSMQDSIGTDKNGNQLDLEKVLKEDNKKEFDEILIDKDINGTLLESLMTLSETERYIMIYRFGICGKDEKTQKTIAKELNISQAYVSKLEKDCLEKMRKYMLAEDLKNGILGKNQYFTY